MSSPAGRVRRVLMTADAVGGVWSYALTLAREFGRAGGRTVLATMGPPPSDDARREARSIPGLRIELGDYRLEWMQEPWADVDRAGEWLLELERRHDPEVVHLNGYAHAALPWRSPGLVVGHSCVLSWWAAVHGSEPPSAYAEYRRRVSAGLETADSIVAPTRAMARALARHYRLSGPPLVLPNGIDLAAWRPGSKEPFVAACGRLWDEAKRLDLLVEVAPGVPWPILVAGEGRRAAAGGDGGAGVRFLGRLEPAALADVLGRASIFAHPAAYEPFGLAVLEAASSGCALVLSDVESLRETWEGAAVFVPPEPTAWAEAIRRLADRPGERARWARAARERSSRYDAASFAARYLDLYARLQPRRRQEA